MLNLGFTHSIQRIGEDTGIAVFRPKILRAGQTPIVKDLTSALIRIVKTCGICGIWEIKVDECPPATDHCIAVRIGSSRPIDGVDHLLLQMVR